MDLSALDTRKAADEGAKLQLRHPVEDSPLTKDDGSPITITLVGSDSATFKRAMQVQADRRLKSNNRRSISMQSIEDDAIDLLSAATIGWDGIVVDGEELPFSNENAKALYERFPWIREQVNAFIGERANFLKA
jgi:hypothetical protein